MIGNNWNNKFEYELLEYLAWFGINGINGIKGNYGNNGAIDLNKNN